MRKARGCPAKTPRLVSDRLINSISCFSLHKSYKLKRSQQVPVPFGWPPTAAVKQYLRCLKRAGPCWLSWCSAVSKASRQTKGSAYRSGERGQGFEAKLTRDLAN